MNLSTESRMSNSSCYVLSTPAHHSPLGWEMVEESRGNDENNASESLDPNCSVHNVTHLGSAIAALRRPMINWP